MWVMCKERYLVSFMEKVLEQSSIVQVSISGSFVNSRNNKKLSIFPGAVYGFAAILSNQQVTSIFDECQKKNTAKLEQKSNWLPIVENMYPLYWGKDKTIGSRPYQHLNNPKGTGCIRLSQYESLAGIEIFVASIPVSDFNVAEKALIKTYPCLLKAITRRL